MDKLYHNVKLIHIYTEDVDGHEIDPIVRDLKRPKTYLFLFTHLNHKIYLWFFI